MFSIKKRNYFPGSDPAGIMFYGNVFTLIHECYEEWLISHNLQETIFKNGEYAFPIVSCGSKFRNPVRHLDELEIRLVSAKSGESSFTLQFELYVNGDTLCAESETVHVCMNKKTQKKALLPQELSALFRRS